MPQAQKKKNIPVEDSKYDGFLHADDLAAMLPLPHLLCTASPQCLTVRCTYCVQSESW